MEDSPHGPSDDRPKEKLEPKGLVEHHIVKHLSAEHTPRQRILAMFTGRIMERAFKEARKPVQDYCDSNLPLTAEQVRELPFYDTTLQAIKWQRDAYLVGPQYADQRRREREVEAKERSSRRRPRWISEQNDEKNDPSNLPMNRVDKPMPGSFNIANRPRFFLRRRNAVVMPPHMPYDATALGSQQIAQIGNSFIPSDTVRLALLPIVVQLPTNSLYEPIVLSVVNSVPLAQASLNQVIINNLALFLKDPNMRRMIKEQTQNIIGDQGQQQLDKTAKESRRRIVRRALRRENEVQGEED